MERHSSGAGNARVRIPATRSPSAYDGTGRVQWSAPRNGMPAPDDVAWRHGDARRAGDAREAEVQAALAEVRAQVRADLRARIGDPAFDALEAAGMLP